MLRGGKGERRTEEELDEKFFSSFAQMIGARTFFKKKGNNPCCLYFDTQDKAKCFTPILSHSKQKYENKDIIVPNEECSKWRINLTVVEQHQLCKKYYIFFWMKEHFHLENCKLSWKGNDIDFNFNVDESTDPQLKFLYNNQGHDFNKNFSNLVSPAKGSNRPWFSFLTYKMLEEVYDIIDSYSDDTYRSYQELYRLAVTITLYEGYVDADKRNDEENKKVWRAALEKDLKQAHGHSFAWKKLVRLISMAIGIGVGFGLGGPAGALAGGAVLSLVAESFFYYNREKGLAKAIRSELNKTKQNKT